MGNRLVIGAGRVGSAVVAAWAASGHSVTVIDVSPQRLEFLNRYLGLVPEVLPRDNRVTSILGSGDDRSVLRDALDACDVVAIFTNGPFPAKESNEREWTRAFDSTSRAVRDEVLARDQPIDVIVGSTVTVYGSPSPTTRVIDEQTVPMPTDVVGRSIREAELVWDGVDNPVITTLAVLRFGHIYGQRHEPDHPMAMARLMSGRTLSYPSDSIACLVSLHDVVASVDHAIAAKLRGPVNVVHDETSTRSEVYDAWCDAAGIPRPLWAPESGRILTYSSARLRESGFTFRDPQPGHGPQASPTAECLDPAPIGAAGPITAATTAARTDEREEGAT